MTPSDQPPLFIPLRKEWFYAFKAGTKTVEYRRAGNRWSETNCARGRPVILSLGYSGERLHGIVRFFAVLPPESCPEAAIEIYGRVPIAAIGILLSRKHGAR